MSCLAANIEACKQSSRKKRILCRGLNFFGLFLFRLFNNFRLWLGNLISGWRLSDCQNMQILWQPFAKIRNESEINTARGKSIGIAWNGQRCSLFRFYAASPRIELFFVCLWLLHRSIHVDTFDDGKTRKEMRNNLCVSGPFIKPDPTEWCVKVHDGSESLVESDSVSYGALCSITEFDYWICMPLNSA